MTAIKRAGIVIVSVLQIYLMDWAIGWLVVAATVTVYSTAGLMCGVAVVVLVWYAVYFFQVALVEAFVKGADTAPESRTKFQAYVVSLTKTMIAPVHGVRALKTRYIHPNTTSSPRLKITTLLLGSWAAGSLLFMAYRRTRDGGLYHGFWRHARVAAAVFAVRFALTYAALPLVAAKSLS